MRQSFNNPTLKPIRRKLRQIPPEPENRLWYYLRSRRLQKTKFRRQYSIGQYVVDFYCPSARLAIEIDGDSHFTDEAEANDKIRTAFLKERGIRVIRFTNSDIMKNIEGVLERIASLIVPHP